MTVATTRCSPRILTTVSAAAALSVALVAPAVASAQHQAGAVPDRHGHGHGHPGAGCHLGHGVKHVVNLVFDNTHFARDNPNVPSDVEQMPHLKQFLEGNGVVFSNTHTPLIAHTAVDSLSIYTGLYGDRHGQPLSNSYRTYNPDGTTDPASSFAYWTDKVANTKSPPTAGHDAAPTMAYSPSVPARTNTGLQAPAPWVPFTRAGCTVGNFSTANMVLENAGADLPNVFGPNSPEVAQYNADPSPYKNTETAQYVGVAVHCAHGARICADAKGIRYGQTSPSHTATSDVLPTEPGGYHGYQALFGARYADPQVGAGTPNVFHHGYRVTDAQGNLVDLSGNTITNQYTGTPGFPGFSPTATQSLAYIADMQEAGVPVTYGYISDLHEVKPGDTGCTTASATSPGKPVGPGDSCYVNNAKAYDAAFAKFFKRLAADGINKHNTLFVIGAEENDQFDGANVGRATQPTPAGCDGVNVPCSYGAGQIGELQVNILAQLAGTPSATTPFDIEPQGASVYARGHPAPNNPALRQLQRDTSKMTATNPYSGAVGQHIVKYQAGAVEERILHMQTSDPLRKPSYTMFPVPDYYFGTRGPPVSINSGYAYNHGYYSPNIDITWSSFVGPGVRSAGVNGPRPAQSNQAHDPNSVHTVPQASRIGTWVEEVDLRPTMLYLTGLRDDYLSDGSVIMQALRQPSRSLQHTRQLAAKYAQLNSSVGRFATLTLRADSVALASGSGSGDSRFIRTQRALTRLADARDKLAGEMKALLTRASTGHNVPPGQMRRAIAEADVLIAQARRLAAR
ncbi:MAG: hypothetical protein M3130_05545 [Actinomycetota bacterium]|nr:hypothetical protein [Actinomycetota bacterium]